MKKYPHTFGTPGAFMFQLTVLGHAVRSCCYKEAVEAAFYCQLTKHYLGAFRMKYEPSLDVEEFTMLAHRKSIPLTDVMRALPALPDRVRDFLLSIDSELVAYRDSLPEIPEWQKLESSENPAVAKWANQCACADQIVKEHQSVNSSSFFLRLTVAEKSLATAINSLKLARRLHPDNPPPALQNRCSKVSGFVERLQEDLEYLKAIAAEMRKAEADAVHALNVLECNRPPLY